MAIVKVPTVCGSGTHLATRPRNSDADRNYISRSWIIFNCSRVSLRVGWLRDFYEFQWGNRNELGALIKQLL